MMRPMAPVLSSPGCGGGGGSCGGGGGFNPGGSIGPEILPAPVPVPGGGLAVQTSDTKLIILFFL